MAICRDEASYVYIWRIQKKMTIYDDDYITIYMIHLNDMYPIYVMGAYRSEEDAVGVVPPSVPVCFFRTPPLFITITGSSAEFPTRASSFKSTRHFNLYRFRDDRYAGMLDATTAHRLFECRRVNL